MTDRQWNIVLGILLNLVMIKATGGLWILILLLITKVGRMIVLAIITVGTTLLYGITGLVIEAIVIIIGLNIVDEYRWRKEHRR